MQSSDSLSIALGVLSLGLGLLLAAFGERLARVAGLLATIVGAIWLAMWFGSYGIETSSIALNCTRVAYPSLEFLFSDDEIFVYTLFLPIPKSNFATGVNRVSKDQFGGWS